MNGPLVDSNALASSSEKLRVAVIGGGHLGRIHAKLLSTRDDVQFVAVVDPFEPSRKLVEQSLGLSVCEDYRSILDPIDAVVVAAPTTLHNEIGTWFLERGVHVLIEKPIAASVDEASHLCRLADSRGCCLQVGHVERFNPAWTAAQRHTSDSAIQYIEARREGVYTGRSTDIGIVLDLMIHDIDLVLSLVKSPVESIVAYGRRVLGNHEDYAVAQLVFRNGCMAQLKASRISEHQARCMDIQCEDEWLSIDFAAGRLFVTKAREEVACGDLLADRLSAPERAKVKDELYDRWLVREVVTPESHNAIVCEHDDFLSSIRSHRAPQVTGRAGLSALQIACEITDQISARDSIRRGVIPATRFEAARRKAG